jgi:hypothetical protein
MLVAHGQQQTPKERLASRPQASKEELLPPINPSISSSMGNALPTSVGAEFKALAVSLRQ